MKNKDNIVVFPKENNTIKDEDSLIENLKNYKNDYIIEVSSFITDIVMTELERANVFVDDDDLSDVILVSESIKSLMMKKYGMEHPLQNMVELFPLDENETEEDMEEIE